MSTGNNRLYAGRLLARNVIWNLVGMGMPLLIAIVAIPILLQGIGTERFGVLVIAWAFVGYFSLFDLGLGRALTQMVAAKLGAGELDQVPSLIRRALALMLGLGLLASGITIGLTPWLVGEVLHIPAELSDESLDVFRLLGLSVPMVIVATSLRGVLEAYQRFDLVNAVRIPLGIANFLGPLLVMPFSTSLVPMVAVLVAARLAALFAQLLLCRSLVPGLLGGERKPAVLGTVHRLLAFGGWMTVSNVVGPVMVYFDRFIIGATLGMTAVTHYATPYEIVTKLWLLPAALASVLFPAFATSRTDDRNTALNLIDRGLNHLLLVLFPLTLLIVAFAREGLTLWLQSGFAERSYEVLRWLAIGVFVNSLAQLAFALVQGRGRPDLTAKLHMLELPFYLLAMWFLIGRYGIVGAAIAWTMRAAVDAVALFAMVRLLVPGYGAHLPNHVVRVLLALLALALAAVFESFVTRIAYVAIVGVAFALLGWYTLLTIDERALVRARLPG